MEIQKRRSFKAPVGNFGAIHDLSSHLFQDEIIRTVWSLCIHELIHAMNEHWTITMFWSDHFIYEWWISLNSLIRNKYRGSTRVRQCVRFRTEARCEDESWTGPILKSVFSKPLLSIESFLSDLVSFINTTWYLDLHLFLTLL